jgi:hypothetical protein
MPTAIVHKRRVRPDDATLIKQMQAVIEHLDRLQGQALDLAFQLDWESDKASANRLKAPQESLSQLAVGLKK